MKLIGRNETQLSNYDISHAELYKAPPRNWKETDILLVDVSGSMSEKDFYPSRLDAAKKACYAYAESKYKNGLEDEIAIVSYSASARPRFKFASVYAAINPLAQMLKEMQTEGSTNIRKGLECAYEMLFNQNDSADYKGKKKHVILLSDGHDTDSNRDRIIEAAGKIKEKNCLISCIGIGGNPSDVDEGLLKGIASIVNNETQYWFITDADSLNEKYQELATGLVVYNPQTAIKQSRF
jgi:Mg-chelatase subunit ChlD